MTSSCIVSEEKFMEYTAKGEIETHGQIYNYLTCNTYDMIEEHAPNMVFVYYKQEVDRLQNLLLAKKYHCPELLGKPVLANSVSNTKQCRQKRSPCEIEQTREADCEAD